MTTLERGKRIAEELGLVVERVYADGLPRNMRDYWLTYRADDIHRLLGESVEVNAHQSSLDVGGWYEGDVEPEPTHIALLIGVRPIVEESEERKLLRELLNAQEFSKINVTYIPEDWAERARKLLEKV